MKRVCLTGISGSIGIHFFAHIMHNTDWHVIGIASFRHKGWSDRIEHMFIEHPEWRSRLTLITHDLYGPISEVAKEKIGHVDYIINLASNSDVFDSIKNPVPFFIQNIWSTINMLEYARDVKPKVFIQFSTDEVLGPTDGKKFLKEWEKYMPSNPYASSKASQEMLAIAWWRTYDVPVIITNTMNNFGEMQQANKFPVIIQKALMNDQSVEIHAELNGEIGSRSYVHSRNVADAVLFILQNVTPHKHIPLTIDEPDKFHIAGDKQLTNLELAQLIAHLMGKELKYTIKDSHTARPGHDPHYGLDDSKLRALGWKPPLTFEESLKNTIEWQSAHPEWIGYKKSDIKLPEHETRS